LHSKHAGLLSLALAALAAGSSIAADGASVAGEPVLEAPTLHSLGVYWIVRGDDNRNASVKVSYCKAGAEKWSDGPFLFRVEKGPYGDDRRANALDVPADAWLFAGSVLFLEPATEYDLRLTLSDPDGGKAEQVLRSRTISEPRVSPDAPRRHVVPGDGGGSGSEADPFRGLATAHNAAKAGDVFLLHAGLYPGTFEVKRNGEPGKPIVWSAAGDGEAVLDVPAEASARRASNIAAAGVHDVWFEGLTIRGGISGISANEAARLVVRRCRITGVDYGLVATRNPKGQVAGFFVSDNVIEGPSTWPRSKGIEPARGIQLSGTGHVVCYNRIRGFADAIDTFKSPVCASIDIHNNDLSELTDDGIELDYSQRNVRCFSNRLTNVYQGVSAQPVYGGPVYVLRNAMYNVAAEPLKLHNQPSGVLFIHNTVVKAGHPMLVQTGEPVSNIVSRNNLFVGTNAPYAMEFSPEATACDFDYDGFAGGPFNLFLKWNGQRYKTADEARAKAPVYRNARILEAAGLFASGVMPPAGAKEQFPVSVNDLRLKEGSRAVDAGRPLPGANDGFNGSGPDLGAYERGAALPRYGPRPR
jgi:hypothetical protein